MQRTGQVVMEVHQEDIVVALSGETILRSHTKKEGQIAVGTSQVQDAIRTRQMFTRQAGVAVGVITSIIKMTIEMMLSGTRVEAVALDSWRKIGPIQVETQSLHQQLTVTLQIMMLVAKEIKRTLVRRMVTPK